MSLRHLLPLYCVLLWSGGTAFSQITAGTCLRFNGTNSYLAVTHDAALNSYPLTITAWIRTIRNIPLYDGVVSKYPPGSGTGYSLHLYNGRLRGWYFRDPLNYVYPGDPGFDGGFIADGQWHHVAMVIGPTGGAIYIDGVSRGAPQGWTGTAGVTTTTQPITIGRYAVSASYTNTFAGDIDEPTIWNRALSLSEINYLKHRRLNGNEDGLLSLWRFSEGSGGTAADAAAAGRVAALNGLVAWKPSAAPIVLAMVATNCLRFDGVNGYVSVPHNTNFNAYPFTAMGWFRTANTTSPLVQGIVNKYQDSSGNGWALIVQNNKLRGFYYRTLSNFGMDLSSAANVTDGAWHHAAMVVDASGGKLFLDGVLVSSGGWIGVAGPPTGVEPLQIGHYYNYAERFSGSLDEISVWNRGLTASEIQSLKNRPLAGTETNLIGYWRMNEGSSTNLSDATGHGHNGSFVGPITWIGSSAFLGDGSVQVRGAADLPVGQRFFAINGAASGANAFAMFAYGSIWRFYDFGSAPANTSVTARIIPGLQVSATGTPIAVAASAHLLPLNLGAYNASSPPGAGAAGGFAALNSAFEVPPDAGVQLDSVNNLHQMTASLSHSENGGEFLTDGTEATDPSRLLHFNGHVLFGNIDTVVTNVVTPPTNGIISAPTHLASQLALADDYGHLVAAPSFTYPHTFGTTLNVNLGANGFATNLNSFPYNLNEVGQFFETNGIRYQLSGALLGTNGLTATNLLAWFPTGFGMSVSPTIRVLKPFIRSTNAVIGPNLAPTNATLTFTAASYKTNQLYFAEESKPVVFSAPQIEWRIPQGEFYIASPQTLQFVRQADDDFLASQRTNLVDLSASDRISNDGYYRNASTYPGAPVYVRPDTNGAALLDLSVALSGADYRPHFPYLNRDTGGVITTLSGLVEIKDDLVNVNTSYSAVSNPVPLAYARDCPPESSCIAPAKTGPTVLPFTTTTFKFTRDGGMYAYGSVAPTNLTWGFVSGTNFAQRTSDVQDGVYHVSGTFLRGDQTFLPDEQRPAVMLFTGWGNDTNLLTSSSYVERPGTSNYNNGFANYAGLNFRTPAQGHSVIAGQPSGWYPLTSRAKYYARYGGVNGIHEAASFPASMTLYGYPFTFLGYRLSFLDSRNWESRTDGAVALGGPAGFNVEFERMKFLCRGNLDDAHLPPTIGTKHMVYWNADIKPQSLQFKPKSTDPCSLTERFLVLGVETRLPFIPEALHATLGFKPNGNLVSKATEVQGADSRFPVPVNLRVQGPGGSYYPLTTVSEGYFNNWETTGKPAAGFYNIAGRVRLPFFRDAKVHLHITPVTPSVAQLDLMGGWPSETGAATDRGWNISGNNYFTTSKFDANQDGWPTGTALDAYRRSTSEQYRPRAQQNWIDVAGFDYPLMWDPLLRQFTGFADASVSLPVIDVNSRLKELTPGKVDFDFAQDLNVQLPRVKLLDFANDAINEINGPINSVSNAIRQELSGNLNGLTSGFRSLQTMMRENADNFFRPVLQPALDPVVNNLYPVLSNALTVNRSNLLYTTPAIIAASSNGLQTAIQALNGTAANANTVFGKLNTSLNDVDDTLGLFIRILEKDASGKRHVVRVIVQKLAADQGPALGFAGGLADQVVNDLLTDLEPTMAKVEGELRSLRSQFSQLRSQVTLASGDLNSALNAANHDAAALQNYLQLASAGVSNLLDMTVGPTGDFFSADPERAKREIRERLIITFLSSTVDAKYQQTFRQFFTDKNFLMDQLLDVLFDQINRSIRNGLEAQIAGARDGIFQNMKGAGLLSGSLLSAKIRGAPKFTGDSLDSIHLNSDMKMNLPDEMKFSAFMDIVRFKSATTPIACIPSGAPAAEVTLGARDVPLDWLGVASTDGQKLRLSVAARWTLQSGSVKGIGGSLEVAGKAGFKGCSMSGIKAALAIGQTENYFAGQAKATVTIIGIPVDFRAGFFAGHACSLQPLKFVDPEAEKVIQQAGDFSGIYLEYGGGLSLSDILFGVSNDLLDVRADITTALFYQGGPRFGRIGGRQKTSVDIKLLYVFGGHADWAVFMVLDSAGQLTVGGEANVCGTIGVCPICEEGCKSVSIKGVVNDGGIDYFIDY